MASGNAIRGTRVGSGPDPVGRAVPNRCPAARSATGAPTGTDRALFAAEVDAAAAWDCPRCGWPAGQDEANPPGARRAEPYKSHLAYVKERRSDADGEAILAEALATRSATRRG